MILITFFGSSRYLPIFKSIVTWCHGMTPSSGTTVSHPDHNLPLLHLATSMVFVFFSVPRFFQRPFWGGGPIQFPRVYIPGDFFNILSFHILCLTFEERSNRWSGARHHCQCSSPTGGFDGISTARQTTIETTSVDTPKHHRYQSLTR